MNPVTGADITAYYSQTLSTGDVDAYGLVTAFAVDKVDVYYRILYHETATLPNVWVFLSDIPWERWFFGVKVKIGYLVRNGISYNASPVRTVDQIKIETHDLTDDIPANTASVTINVPSDISPFQETPHDFGFVCGGDIGDLHGGVNLRWKDLTKFVSGGRITLTKYGVTSPGVRQTLFDQTFSSFPFTFAPDYSTSNFIGMPFLLLPPGIQLPDPPVFTTASGEPISNDPNAPLWVVEGDLLTVTLTTLNNSPNANAATITATYNFHYRHRVKFYQFADSATVDHPYRKQIEIIQDPWVPIPIEGTFAMNGPFPPGPVGAGAWDLTTGGLLTCTSPTQIGSYTLRVLVTNQSHGISVEPIFLAVNIAGKPVIMAPPQTLPLTLGLPFPEAYSLYATNHPTHWSWTGTLPSGISIDPSTGIISGTPVVPTVSPVNITFFATNAVFVSDAYLTQWSVISYQPPNIISATTATAYLEEAVTYQIETDQQALSWRAFDMPLGLKIIGSVLTGTVDQSVLPGNYTIGIQAANRWGWSPLFQLQLTVAVAPPVIFSPLALTTSVDEQFDYDILASHHPILYDATPLPAGLSLNASTGHLSGIPVAESPDYAINLKALNPGGFGSAALHLAVILPPVPVIDTSSTHGSVITAETGVDVEYTFTASHSPNSWIAFPVPSGLSVAIIPAPAPATGTAVRLFGRFQNGGLYQVALRAHNRGGDSEEDAVINFLVTISSVTAQEINQLGTIMEIWVDLNTAVVQIGNKPTIDEGKPVPPSGTTLPIKRGDTIDLRVVFHEDGIPVNVTLNSLKFGIKSSFDDEFVIFTDTFTSISTGGQTGHFSIKPDFSGTNDDLDAVLVTESTSLKGEVQWEMLDDQGAIVRRSSLIFPVSIFRDLIHPD